MVMNIFRFEPNRVIIRQGHKSEIYYLILSGTAVVTVSSSEHSNTGDPSIKHVAFLKKGNSFGVRIFKRRNVVLSGRNIDHVYK